MGNTQNTITTIQAVELFTKALTGNNYSPMTIQAYTTDLEQFVAWVRGERVDWDYPARFNRMDIVEFLNHLASRKLFGVTRFRKIVSIRKFFTFMHENGYLAGNPANTVKGPIKEHKDPPILYRNEYKALLYEAQGNPRDYAILQTFLQTGIRVSELASLRIEDIDFENKLLTVRQGKGRVDRTIPLEEQARAALKKYYDIRPTVDTEAFFLARNNTSLDVRSIRKIVKKYLDHAGITKKASVHTLRHTFGTHKADKGMPLKVIQELMGHKKMETTYTYIHLAKTSLREHQETTAL
jgi:integrase/recombinase XerC